VETASKRALPCLQQLTLQFPYRPSYADAETVLAKQRLHSVTDLANFRHRLSLGIAVWPTL
jgi:hypothetical protein